MLPASIKQAYNNVPLGIKIFAKKAMLLLAGWLLLYYGLMRPTRVPDEGLTHLTTKVSTLTLNKFYKPGFSFHDTCLVKDNTKTYCTAILLNKQTVIFIADGCNAFDLFVLYMAFLICLPTTIMRFLIFSVVGVLTIFSLNIVRCFALACLTLNNFSYVDFAHHYAFTLIVYSCIFTGWVMYSKKYKANVYVPA